MVLDFGLRPKSEQLKPGLRPNWDEALTNVLILDQSHRAACTNDTYLTSLTNLSNT